MKKFKALLILFVCICLNSSFANVKHSSPSVKNSSKPTGFVTSAKPVTYIGHLTVEFNHASVRTGERVKVGESTLKADVGKDKFEIDLLRNKWHDAKGNVPCRITFNHQVIDSHADLGVKAADSHTTVITGLVVVRLRSFKSPVSCGS